MILIDISTWIEFLRDTGSPTCNRVDAVLGGETTTCDAVRTEVLSSARDEQHLQSLRRLLARAAAIPIEPADYDEAAALYRLCRRQGETVRRLMDCLIAAVAIRADAAVLHNDSDFDTLARHAGLKVDCRR